MPVDLAYWRKRIAVQEHSDSPHIGLTTAQFGGILDELEQLRGKLEERPSKPKGRPRSAVAKG